MFGMLGGSSHLKRATAEKVSEAVSSNVADIDMWAAHTHQVVALLLQIQRTGEEKEKAWAHERTEAAAKAHAAARSTKVENALHAGIVSAQGRGVNATFRSWVAAVRSISSTHACIHIDNGTLHVHVHRIREQVRAMREAEAEARRDRAAQRTERLASAGRGEMLDEHSRLLRDAAQAGRTVQGMKAKLQERSQVRRAARPRTALHQVAPRRAALHCTAPALRLPCRRSSSVLCCAIR